jgi:small-conductance mechanosensitive channel
MLPTSVTERIFELLQWPGVALVLVATLACWVVNRLLRGRWTATRRSLMTARFIRLLQSLGLGLGLLGMAELLNRVAASAWLTGPLGFAALVTWLVACLRVARVAVLLWLFANSAREGVPLVLVDLFSAVATLVLGAALLHSVFLIEVTSLLATSAVASVVLGLALQDTLGNLFAGISLQVDRSFRLGDWVEVRSGADRIAGQVLELTWRSTVLLAISEEIITIPNRTVAQGLVLNFSGRERPFVRSHLFRVPLDADLAVVRAALVEAAKATPGVLAEPAPVPLLIETTESWVAVKMINYVRDYGQQFTVGDEFQSRALKLLEERGVKLATDRVLVEAPPVGAAPTPAPAPK